MKFRILIVIVLAFLPYASAFAHGGEPRIEISVDRVYPGGILDLRGVEFDYEETVVLALVGTQGEIFLGEVTTDFGGVFLQTVTLPADLGEGTYYFRGTTSHHYVLSPALTVWGTANVEEGAQGPWDEEEPLLAPMPTFAPGVVPGVVTGSAPIASSAQVESQTAFSGLDTNILILAGLMVIVIILVFGMLRKRPR